MSADQELEAAIVALVRRIQGDWDERHALGQRDLVAVALVLNKPEWLPAECQHPLDAMMYLGVRYLAACTRIHRQGLCDR